MATTEHQKDRGASARRPLKIQQTSYKSSKPTKGILVVRACFFYPSTEAVFEGIWPVEYILAKL